MVDSSGVLLGIVTVDDLLDVAEEEATEDFQKVGSVEPLRTSFRAASIGELYRRRIPWLLGLVVMNIFSGAGIAAFEATIAATVALVFFLPLLIDSVGNAGSQSATLMVRALATGDVKIRDWFHVLRRELAVALTLGVTMATAVSLLGFWRGGFPVTLAVALSMLLIVLVGSMVGMALPFVLDRAKLDPATRQRSPGHLHRGHRRGADLLLHCHLDPRSLAGPLLRTGLTPQPEGHRLGARG